MPVPVEREKVRFVSGGTECAAWHYPGTNGGHYEPFLDGHEQAAEAELSFLRRHLLDRSRAAQPAEVAADSMRH